MSRTRDWMNAFLEQARSDWQAYHLKMHFANALPLANAIERLAPALAGGGINPEYPWESPNGIVHTPATYTFDLTQDLSTPKGVNLLKDVGPMLRRFEKLFG